MSLSMHTASVPVFQQMLTALGGVLAKAEAHAAERKIDPAALLQARLFPDMFPLARQVQIACDFATSVPGRNRTSRCPLPSNRAASRPPMKARVAAIRCCRSANVWSPPS